jgi:hypothetical protein
MICNVKPSLRPKEEYVLRLVWERGFECNIWPQARGNDKRMQEILHIYEFLDMYSSTKLTHYSGSYTKTYEYLCLTLYYTYHLL